MTLDCISARVARAARLSSKNWALTPLAMACALASLGAAPLALANDTLALEELTVESAKRPHTTQTFTGAISVLSDLDQTSSLADIARQVPGFSLVDAGPRNPAGLIMRGLRMDEVGPNDFGGDGSTVATYVDNIPLQGYFAPPSVSLKDLQQVEVVRGPQGTLYGNASVGGVIRYVTAKPDLTQYSVTLGAEVSQTKHSDDLSYDTDLVVNAPLLDNSLGLRLLLGKTDNAGFIDNPYRLFGAQEDINDDQAKQARLSLLWQATEDFSLSSSYHYQKINVADRQAANREFTGDDYSASSRYPQPMEGELHLASIDASYDLGFAELSATLSHYDYQHQEAADQTDFYLGHMYYPDFPDLTAFIAADLEVKKDSLEVRLVSPDNQPLRWLVGGFYSTDELEVMSIEVVPGLYDYLDGGSGSDIDYAAYQQEDLKEYALFGELAYDLTERWELSAGARYFRYDDDLTFIAAYPYYDEFYPEYGDDVNNGVLGKLGSRYTFNDEHSIYVTVAEGYRRGGANLTPPDITTNRFYAPDKATNYELGWRMRTWQQRVQLNTALFVTNWEDIQVQTQAEEDGRTIFSNAGHARTQGIEADLTLQINSVLQLRGSYSYTQAELTETREDLDVYDGDRLPGTPRTQMSVALDYRQTLGSVALDASLALSRTGKVYTALNDSYYNYQQLDAYTLLDLDLGVTLDAWRLGAFVNNVTNSRAVTGGQFDDFYGDQGQFEYLVRPRTIGLSARYSY